MGKQGRPGQLDDITTRSMGEIGALQIKASDRPGGFMVDVSLIRAGATCGSGMAK